MPEPRRLPFTLADAMFLVAATTPGLILLRIAAGFGLFKANLLQKSPPGRNFVEYLSTGGGCVLFSLTLAVLILTARRPHPRMRDVIGGPGFVACLTVMVASVFPLAYFAVRVVTYHRLATDLAVPFGNMFGRLVHGAGPMIVAAWLALALVGRWRLKPTWTDRLGCVVGSCWILIYLYIDLYLIGVVPLLLPWAT